MNMKKLLCLLFAIVMVVSLAGCNRKNNEQSGNVIEDELSMGGTNAGNEMDDDDLIDDDDEIAVTGSGEEFSDKNVRIDVRMTKEAYTLNEAIDVNVTITNIADTPIIYVIGSGSNIAPDALEINLDELSPMFRPFQMTMDYGTEVLEPGQSKTYELPYAPYIAHSEDTVIGLDRDLDFFQTEEFRAADYGEIEGTLRFTYVLSEASDVEDALDLIDNNEAHVLEGRFKTSIIEDDNDVDHQELDAGMGLDDDNSDNDGLLDDILE